MPITPIIIASVVSLLVGGAITLLITKKMAHSAAKNIIEEAKLEADVLKKNKLLEAKEEELRMKAEVEKQANARHRAPPERSGKDAQERTGNT